MSNDERESHRGPSRAALLVAGALAFGPSAGSAQPTALDFGDAPAPYPTRLADLGASHLLGSGVFLGPCVDAEVDGQPSVAAIDDDQRPGSPTFGTCPKNSSDEDGVVFTSTPIQGQTATLTVFAQQPCILSAYLDTNGDGDWADAGETLFPGGAPLVAGANALQYEVPLTNLGIRLAIGRFRCTTQGEVPPTGPAADGEVEDHSTLVDLPRSSGVHLDKTARLALDGNGNGRADPGDHLLYSIAIEHRGSATAFAAIFRDTPDPFAPLLAGTVTTTQGEIVFGNRLGDTRVVIALGDVLPATRATLTFRAQILDPLPRAVASVANQGQWEALNHAALATDDPAVAGLQATVTPIVRTSAVEIPTLSSWGFNALGLLLGGLGAWRLATARRSKTL